MRDGDIDCDFALEGGLIVATSPAQVDGVLEAAGLARELGRDDIFRELGKDEAADLWGSPATEAGVLLLHAGSVQPALLAQGLRRMAVAAGVRIYEATPMVAVQRTLPAVVKTPSGAVVADKVVLASGARLALVPELRRTIFVIPSHVVATASSQEVLDRLGWATGRPFADGRTAVHYGQRTADDRVVFGTRRRPPRVRRPRHPRALSRRAGRSTASSGTCTACCRPRGISAVSWYWGGPVERTQHGLPWVGVLGKYRNVHYGVGYSGNGVAPSNLIGLYAGLGRPGPPGRLRAVSAGLRTADVPAAGAHPFRRRPRRCAAPIERCEALEDEGRRPDLVSRSLRRCLSLSMPSGWTERRGDSRQPV